MLIDHLSTGYKFFIILLKISAKLIIVKDKIKIKNTVLIVLWNTNLKLLLILYEKKPIVAPIEFTIISSVSKLPTYVII